MVRGGASPAHYGASRLREVHPGTAAEAGRFMGMFGHCPRSCLFFAWVSAALMNQAPGCTLPGARVGGVLGVKWRGGSGRASGLSHSDEPVIVHTAMLVHLCEISAGFLPGHITRGLSFRPTEGPLDP